MLRRVMIGRLGIVGDFVIYSSSRPGMNQDDAWR
jgi:hypothetical protein